MNFMKNIGICGLQKTTLLDYPGYVACTVFLGGCNFCCPFCHNSELLSREAPAVYSLEELLAFLKKRSGVLEGVCVTGGEPTLQPENLEYLLAAIRETGMHIKLDTNGSRPQILRHLNDMGLLDMVAMDIKAAPEHYPAVCGLSSVDMDAIQETVHWLKNGTLSYEFRTTAVKGLHTEEDFLQIGPWIAGSPHYYLQNYTGSEQVLHPEGFDSFRKEELLCFADLVKPYVGDVSLRGADY